MAQPASGNSWMIQGSNGQMIKLIHTPGAKSIGGVVSTSSVASSAVPGQSLKMFKASTNQEFVQTSGSAQSQIVKTVGHKFISKGVPVHVNAMPKGAKTIRLTPSQMQNIKMVSSSPQKIHLAQTSPTSISTSTTLQTIATLKNVSPPILQRKRHDPLDLEILPESKRSRKADKVGKGLRHFSMKVCEKVQKKGVTSYNEVADELVTEFANSASQSSLADQYDQKNIRRRVYDALNVLMAMNIISKEKKEIKWIGLPTNSLQECTQLEKEKQKRLHNIREKKKQLFELILRQIAFKNLAQRNKQMEEEHGSPPPSSFIQLPFIVVNTNKKTVIDCSISNDKLEYLFQFNDTFEIHDDVDILKSIGMLMGLETGECTTENLEKIKSMVPKSLVEYVDQIADRDTTDIDLESEAGTSTSLLLGAEDLVEAHLDEENSRQSSSFDPLSPSGGDYSDDEGESDLSSDIE